MDVALFLETADDEGLKKDERHFLGKPALVELEFRPDDDDRTTRVIDALAEKILAEPSAFALEHVAEGFQRAVGGPGDSATVAAVVKQRIDGLLKHPFFVADDDLWGLELEQRAETVIAIDDAAVKIVEIGGRETSTFERHERAEVRRDDREHIENHPFRTRPR